MLIVPLVVGPWQANCYVVASGEGTPEQPADCLAIDVGMDAQGPLQEVLDEFHLRLDGVVATHGHIDHVADAAAVADRAGVAVYIHPADEHLLTHPGEGLSPELAALSRQLFGDTRTPPQRVEHLVDGGSITLAGLTLTASEAPGHSPGCTMLRLEGFPVHDQQGREVARVPVVFTGDVVFAGSIGRTDLPGSNADQMRDSLRERVLTLSDDTYLLPGHGAATTMGAERRTNPFLQALAERGR